MDGLQIRNFRQNQGMSLRAFGKQVGVSYERVRQLENYDYISPEIQERICAAFSVDSADPLFLTTPNPAPQPDKKTRKAQAVRKKEEQAALKPVRAAYAREIRMKAGLSQKALAAAMGVGQTQISAWECGQHFISDATMERIEMAVLHTQPKEKKKRTIKPRRPRETEPFITVCRSGLLLSKAVMDRLGDSGRVKVYYLEKEKLLAIKAAKEGEEDTQRLYTKGQAKLNNAGVRKVAEKLLGFEVGDGHCRVAGTWTLDEEYEYWMFDFSSVCA